jgi:hypothetical protein
MTTSKDKIIKDLFPEKKFIFTKINGIEYISKDIFEELMKQAKQKFKDAVKNTNKIKRHSCFWINEQELLKALGEKMNKENFEISDKEKTAFINGLKDKIIVEVEAFKDSNDNVHIASERNITLEEVMKESGWVRTERENAGKVYVEYIKNGFIIDEEDILEEK